MIFNLPVFYIMSTQFVDLLLKSTAVAELLISMLLQLQLSKLLQLQMLLQLQLSIMLQQAWGN